MTCPDLPRFTSRVWLERLPDGRVAVRKWVQGEARTVTLAIVDDWEEAEAVAEAYW